MYKEWLVYNEEKKQIISVHNSYIEADKMAEKLAMAQPNNQYSLFEKIYTFKAKPVEVGKQKITENAPQPAPDDEIPF